MQTLSYVLLLAVLPFSGRQDSSPEQTALLDGDVAVLNINNAIAEHQIDDPQFRIQKQKPELPNPDPSVITRDGKLSVDWTPGQHARHLMEEIRQGLYALQNSKQRIFADYLAIDQGRKAWPELRDISCKDKPGADYWDLDGLPRRCPKALSGNYVSR